MSIAPATQGIIDMFDYVWARLGTRLEGLDDEEYFWEPVSGCWSLRRGDDGVWRLDGEGGGGPPPEPVPFTTIAWRIGHVAALAVGGFAEARFGSAEPAADTHGFPAHADEVPAFLDRNYRPWRDGLQGLDEEAWLAPIGPSFGPYADQNSIDLALHVLDEVIHHAGEIGVLRDLYAHKDEFTQAG